VARKLGIAEAEMARVTDEILARHRFMMTKPDWRTFRKSKAAAAWRMLGACAHSPRIALDYVRCRADRDRFFANFAADFARRMAPIHALS
jgi:hypothetical protein